MKFTKEHRCKLSIAAKKRCTLKWRTEKSIQMKNLDRKPCSEETKQRISIATLGKNRGNKAWNRGLTKETDLRVKELGISTGNTKRGHSWKGDDIKHGRFLTLGQYKQMFKFQNGVCAICGKTETRKTAKGKTCKLMVDHDHLTEEVRGLLCHKCNVGLGLMMDNIDNLKQAIKYLNGGNYNGFRHLQ